MKTIKLDAYEQDLEDEADNFKPVSPETRKKIETIIATANKSKNINIRISEYDLERIKQKSIAAGLPYQTLLSSVIHQYVTDKLIDESAILKSIQLLRSG